MPRSTTRPTSGSASLWCSATSRWRTPGWWCSGVRDERASGRVQMSLIAFASAKGSPGVSHAVGELARLWTGDAVVADVDPVGGDVMLVQRDRDGDPLNADTGLVSLGA